MRNRQHAAVGHSRKLKRREFCQKMVISGGVLLAAPLLKACASPDNQGAMTIPRPTSATQLLATLSPSATAPMPTASVAVSSPTSSSELVHEEVVDPGQEQIVTPITGKSVISLVKSSDRAESIGRALALLGINPVKNGRVLLKPNFNSADPAPGSTHPDTLRILVNQLHDWGASHITVGDRSGMGNTGLVLEQLGIFELSKELDFETVIFDEFTTSDWVILKDSDFHWTEGFQIPRLLIESDCIIQTCNLKTHRYGGHFTLSLKNSVGFAAKTVPDNSHDYMRELHNSNYQRKMIAEINTAYKPDLIVMDGIEAFVSGGPATGQKVQSEVVLAGTDPVAMDAVGVAILRLFGTTREVSRGKIFEQEQIARAVELGLGEKNPGDIQFVTPDAESAAYASLISSELARSG